MKRALLAMILLSAVDLRGDVTGALVSPDGKPVAAGRIELFSVTPSSVRLEQLKSATAVEPIATAESDSKGNFKVVVAKRGNYVVRASRDGFAPAGVETTGSEDLGGILMRPAAMKRGRVTANGKPVAKTIVWFHSDSGETTVVTDDEGRYSVPDPAVWHPAVHVFHPDYAPRSARATREPLAATSWQLSNRRRTNRQDRHPLIHHRECAAFIGACRDRDGKRRQLHCRSRIQRAQHDPRPDHSERHTASRRQHRL